MDSGCETLIENCKAGILNSSAPNESLAGNIEMIRQILEDHLYDPSFSLESLTEGDLHANSRLKNNLNTGTESNNMERSASFSANIPEGLLQRSRPSSFSENGSVSGGDTSNSKNVTVKIKIINVNSPAVQIGNHNNSFVSTGSDIDISDPDSYNASDQEEKDHPGDGEHHATPRPQFDLDFNNDEEKAVPDDHWIWNDNVNIMSHLASNEVESDSPGNGDENPDDCPPSSQKLRNEDLSYAASNPKQSPIPRENKCSSQEPVPISKQRNLPQLSPSQHPVRSHSSHPQSYLDQLPEQAQYTCLLTQPYHSSAICQDRSNYTAMRTARFATGTSAPDVESNGSNRTFGNPIYSSSLPTESPQLSHWHPREVGVSEATPRVSVISSGAIESEHGFFDDMSLDHQYLSMGQAGSSLLSHPQSALPVSKPLTEQMIKKARRMKGFYACFNSHSNKEIHAVLKHKIKHDGSYILWQANPMCFVASVVYLRKVFNFKICSDGETLFLNKDGPRAVDLQSLVNLYIKEKIALHVCRRICEEHMKKNNCDTGSVSEPPLPPKPINGFLRLVEPVVLSNEELQNTLATIRRQNSSPR